MIPYARLRSLLAGWPKYPGCQPVRRAPLVTPAFPGDFNLSSTEHHWLRELGGYLDWHRDYVFSTIQSCVRLADFAFLSTADGVRYLGVFEMGDLCGEIALRVRPNYDSLQRWQIAQLIRLLETVGIPPARIHASYSAGGRIADLTGGAYQFDGAIPPDAISRDAFLAAGVPDANLTADATRATLLPWLERNRPDLRAKYERHYGARQGVSARYQTALDARFSALRAAAGIGRDRPTRAPAAQPELWANSEQSA